MAQRYDVIVIGGGGSGLAAAVSCAEHGARVLLLERQPQLGGTSSMAVGSISAAGTQVQRQAGITDDWRDFLADMALFTGDLLTEDHAALREWLARHAADTIDWLSSLGVVFAGPFAEPPHRVYRMHNAVPGAAAITQRLSRACRQLGVKVLTQAQVLALCQHASGRVTGVTFLHDGQRHQVEAQLGVILASGDFSGHDHMRQTHLNPAAARAMPINPNNQGLMFELAREVGAKYTHMHHIFGPQLRFPKGPQASLAERMPAWPWLCRCSKWFFQHAPNSLKKALIKPLMMSHMSPSDVLFEEGALLVDRRGRMLDAQKAPASVAMTEERQAFILMPQPLARRFDGQPHHVSTAPGIAYAGLNDYRKGRSDLVHEANSLEELARQIGLSELDPLDSAWASHKDTPWIALGPVQAMLTTTEGALATAVGGQVLNQWDDVIEGLYAVGCMGQGGLLLRGHGLHLAWAYTSGRMMGAQMAVLKRKAKDAVPA